MPAGADLVSITAHKMYGPKGVGALYVRRASRVELAPLFTGGGQERGLRPGTLNVPGIVGFGAAAELCGRELAAEGPRVAALRDRLLAALQRGLEAVTVNGSMTARLPHNLHVSFAGVDGDALMTGLADDVAASSGSACASGSREPSHVVKALGLGAAESWGAVRFGLGRGTTRSRRGLRGRPRGRPGGAAAGPVAGGSEAGVTTALRYSAEVLRRCQQLERAGSWPDDDPGVGTGIVGSVASGTMTRLQLRVDADGERVTDSLFRVFGCSAAIASASLAADRVVGVRLVVARALDPAAIADALDLPDDKRAMAEHAAAAVRAAVEDWERKPEQRLAASG